MQNNYDYLISKLPWWLGKNEKIQIFYKAVAKLFDIIDSNYNLLEKQWLIDYAEGDFLDLLGIKFNVERNKQTDERYRNRIKLAMKKTNLVPNVETLYEIGNMFTGITPLIETNTNNEPAQYDIKFIANNGYDFSIIDELDLNNIVGGGVRINTEKCLDQYTVGMRFGRKTLGQQVFKNDVEKTPVCNFNYKIYGRFGRNKLAQIDLGAENEISF